MLILCEAVFELKRCLLQEDWVTSADGSSPLPVASPAQAPVRLSPEALPALQPDVQPPLQPPHQLSQVGTHILATSRLAPSAAELPVGLVLQICCWPGTAECHP